MDKAEGEVVDRCRHRGDLGHNEMGENREKVGQSAGKDRGGLEHCSLCKGHGKGDLTHSVEEGYGCILEGHTAFVVGRDSLEKNKN